MSRETLRKEFETAYRANTEEATKVADRPASFAELSCAMRSFLEVLVKLEIRIEKLENELPKRIP